MKMKFVMMALVLSTMAFGGVSAAEAGTAWPSFGARQRVVAASAIEVDPATAPLPLVAEEDVPAITMVQALVRGRNVRKDLEGAAQRAVVTREQADRAAREQAAALRIQAVLRGSKARSPDAMDYALRKAEADQKASVIAATERGIQYAKTRVDAAAREQAEIAAREAAAGGAGAGGDAGLPVPAPAAPAAPAAAPADEEAVDPKALRTHRIKQGAGAAVLAWLLADLGIGVYKANKGFKKLSKEDRKLMKFLSMMLNEMYTVKGVKAGGRLAKRAGSGLARSVRAGYNGTKSFFSKKNRASNVEANAIAA